MNQPRPVGVRTDRESGAPSAVGFQVGRRARRQWYSVVSVLDRWRIDEAWWRPQPIHRLYYRVVLENGAVIDIYRDLAGGGWYEQRYDKERDGENR